MHETTQRTSGAAAPTPARLTDLESLVDCHLAALPDDFVPRLGRDFVRTHDRFYIEQEGGVCLVTRDPESDRVTGFVLGGDPGLRGRLMRRHAPALLGAVLSRSLVDSFVRHHAAGLVQEAALGALRRLGLWPAERDPVPSETPGTWGISVALGTHPDFRTDGAGRAIALLEAMHRENARLGYRTTRAMTATTNLTSHLLHTRLGWTLVKTAGGFHYYRREIPGAESRGPRP